MGRPTKTRDLLPAHARILRFVVYHDVRLHRRPMVVHQPDPVPNVTFARQLHPILPGAVRNGDRHDATPDEGSGHQNPQSGVICGEIIGIDWDITDGYYY